jgi:Holliday junction resolvase RusA-like endonuclease
MKHTLFIIGNPKPEPRARATSRSLGNGKRISTVYKPTTANCWRYPVTLALGELLNKIGAPINRACHFEMTFYFERPKSHWAGGDYRRILPGAPVFQENKPDFDNLSKLVADAAQSCGLLTQDCKICIGNVTKKYATFEPPGLMLTITDELGPATVGTLYDRKLLDLTTNPRRAPCATVFYDQGQSIIAEMGIPTVLP